MKKEPKKSRPIDASTLMPSHHPANRPGQRTSTLRVDLVVRAKRFLAVETIRPRAEPYSFSESA